MFDAPMVLGFDAYHWLCLETVFFLLAITASIWSIYVFASLEDDIRSRHGIPEVAACC